MNSKMCEDTLKRVNKYKKKLDNCEKDDYKVMKDCGKNSRKIRQQPRRT